MTAANALLGKKIEYYHNTCFTSAEENWKAMVFPVKQLASYWGVYTYIAAHLIPP